MRKYRVWRRFRGVPCSLVGNTLLQRRRGFPITAPIFRKVVNDLMDDDLVSPESKILFVDDGPIDKTRDTISDLADQASVYSGIPLSRNRGHQNALLAVCLVKRSSAVSAS